MRCLRTIFPATLLWGATFPIGLASAAAEDEDPARLSGEVYAANTAGSIAGALAFSLALIPAIGTRGSQQVLIGLAAGAAVTANASSVWNALSPMRLRTMVPWTATVVVVAVVLISTMSHLPWQVIAYGRRVAPILRGLGLSAEAEPVFIGEGMN